MFKIVQELNMNFVIVYLFVVILKIIIREYYKEMKKIYLKK